MRVASILQRHDNASDLVDELSNTVVMRLRAAVAARGRGALVVPGGRTPGLLFDALKGRDAPWSRVHVLLTDERWAPGDTAVQNETAVRSRLLRGRAAQARFTPLAIGQNLDDAASRADQAVRDVGSPFDVVIVGMGEDGHVASLFPGAGQAAQGARVAAVHVQGAAGSAARLSLTMPTLLNARFVALMITGAEKLAALHRAMAGSDIDEMPVRALLRQQRAPVRVYWSP